MPRSLPVLFLSLFFATTSACASNGSERPSNSRGPITEVDIAALSMTSAHDVVLHLRPAWLRSRGASSIRTPGGGFPVVFVDHSRYGSPSTLRGIRAAEIESIQFMNSREATTQHGTGYPSGIIRITTKRNDNP